MTDLVAGIDFADVTAAVLAVAGVLAGVAVTMVGARKVLGFIKRG